MNVSPTKALKHLTGDKDLQSVTVQQLSEIVENHPYFPVSRFLLARKLKEENDDKFLAEAQIAAIYFSNPLWFNYQLEEAFNHVDDNEEAEKPFDYNGIARNGLSETEITSASDLAHSTLAENSDSAVENTDQESNDTTLHRPNADAIIEGTDRHIKATEPTIDQPELEAATLARETDQTVDELLDKISAEEHSLESEDSDMEPNEQKVEVSSNGAPITEATEVLEEMAGTSPVHKTTEAFVEESVEADEHEVMYRHIKAMLDASSEEAEADVENAEIPIDPYYTIDYFASQGIRLDLEPHPQDKLGQSLKKFTQWLKHMKKLGPEDSKPDVPKGESDAEIQQIADSSVVAREVVTEAMAAVLEKQGKKDKAIELYNKLSFLNPDKRSYFAAKINNLKGI